MDKKNGQIKIPVEYLDRLRTIEKEIHELLRHGVSFSKFLDFNKSIGFNVFIWESSKYGPYVTVTPDPEKWGGIKYGSIRILSSPSIRKAIAFAQVDSPQQILKFLLKEKDRVIFKNFNVRGSEDLVTRFYLQKKRRVHK